MNQKCFALALMFLCGVLFSGNVEAQFYREDFTSDSNSSVGGFAGSVFVHSVTGNSMFLSPGAAVISPFPDPQPNNHALWLLNGIDAITFSLGQGEYVEHARIYGHSIYGQGIAVVEGTTDSITFNFNQGNSVWQQVDVDQNSVGANGLAIGNIVRITLTGYEAIFDSIEIDVAGGGGPGSITAGIVVDPNRIRPGSNRGAIRVYVLTDSNFNSLDIDPLTVSFSGAAPFHWLVQDYQNDGDLDAVFFFHSIDIQVNCGDTAIPFTAMTYSGVLVQAIGSIRTVGCP